MLVKVCGIKYQDNLDALAALDVDMIGLNFYQPSKRYLSANLDYATLSNDIKKVGVFVNEDIDKVLQLVDLHGLDYAQLHGDESVAYCKALQEKIKVIKVFRVKENIDYNLLKSYRFVDMFLLDTYTDQYGGSGKRFDWRLLKNYTLDIPFLLSGGISPEDAEDLLSLGIPQCIGVDINSKFETAPGLKDITLIKTFIKSIKKIA